MAPLTGWLKRNTKKSRASASASKSSKSSANKSRKSDNTDRAVGDDRFGWANARGIVFAFIGLVATGAAAYGWWAGEPYLIDFVNKHHHATVDVRFTSDMVQVEGVGEQLTRMVENEIGEVGPLGTHAREALDRLHEALVSTGWFSPDNLRLYRDAESGETSDLACDVIIIDGPFRRPFAMVRAGKWDYVVDHDGHRLNVTYEAGTVEVIPVIVGARAESPNVCDTWAGRDVHDGLELLAYLRDRGPAWLAQVREIDVSNAGGSARPREPHLVLITDKGYRIGWGRAVGGEAGIDIPPDEKIRLLNEYAKPRNGRIGDPLGILRVDLPLATLDRDNAAPSGGG